MIDRKVLRAERGFRGDPPGIDSIEGADLERALQMKLVADDDERLPALLQQMVADVEDLLQRRMCMGLLHDPGRIDTTLQQLPPRHLRFRKLVRRIPSGKN